MSQEKLLTRLPSLDDVIERGVRDTLLRMIAGEEVEHILNLAKALWIYDGAPRKEKPHALLTSGKHSNGFVNVGGVIKEHPVICEIFAHSLAIASVRLKQTCPCWVVGADTSSTALAGNVAKFFNAIHVKMIKKEVDGKNIQAWHPENPEKFYLVGPGHCGLQIEELITTAKSALQVREGMRKQVGDNLFFCHYLLTVVNRSTVDNVNESGIVPLLRLDLSDFEPGPETCPYCAAGSEAIKPKVGDNWSRLTAKL